MPQCSLLLLWRQLPVQSAQFLVIVCFAVLPSLLLHLFINCTSSTVRLLHAWHGQLIGGRGCRMHATAAVSSDTSVQNDPMAHTATVPCVVAAPVAPNDSLSQAHHIIVEAMREPCVCMCTCVIQGQRVVQHDAGSTSAGIWVFNS